VKSNEHKSNFAAYGLWIGLAAPGEKVYSTFPVDGYASTSGTSMATPFAAGAVALLRSLAPSLTLDQIGRILGGAARPSGDPIYTGQLGAGVLDVTAAVAALVSGDWPAGANPYAGCTGQ
jgi:subtilisin family serine protease